MDRNKTAILVEAIKCTLGVYFILTQKDWFGASHFFAPIIYVLLFYFTFSFLVTGYFVLTHAKEDKANHLSIA
jgi:hypothetical protein